MQQVLDTLKAQLETGQNISLEHLMAIASHAQEEQAAPVSVHFWPWGQHRPDPSSAAIDIKSNDTEKLPSKSRA